MRPTDSTNPVRRPGGNEFPFRKIRRGTLKGWLRRDLIPLLPERFFEDPAASLREMSSRTLKDSKRRWAAIFSLPGGRRVFLKLDRSGGRWDALKYSVLPTKARREWAMACRMEGRGLPVPRPLGWLERSRSGFIRESFYLSEAIGSGVSVIDSASSPTEETVDALAQTVKAFHASGLFHKDLHGGNFIRDGDLFYLTDLHRAEVRKALTLKQRLWNLAQLFHSLRDTWEEKDFARFMNRYGGQGPRPLQPAEGDLEQVHSCMKHLLKRQWKSRTRRCLIESSSFSVERSRGSVMYHRRRFGTDHVRRGLEAHHTLLQRRRSALLKDSPGVIVSRLGGLVIKQFRYPRWIDRFKEAFRTSKGLKAWIAGNGLKVRRIPTFEAVALLEKRGTVLVKESYLLMETPEKGEELDRYLFRGLGDFRRTRVFIRAFADWVSDLHQKGVYHGDMKACNILVLESEGEWLFHLLDLEDVKLDRRVGEQKLFRNLLQLNTSIPGSVSRRDRLRFFIAYHDRNPLIRDRRAFLSTLSSASRKRGVVYVTPRGVVEERWS